MTGPALEYKASPTALMGIDDRTVTGVFAVHGNIDDGGDRSHPGLFDAALAGQRQRVVHLWQHDGQAPPIATVDRIFEVAAGDLPAAVKLYAPDATGGVAVQRTYLETPRAAEVLAGLVSGAIKEMSYAYVPTRWDYEDSDAGFLRNLYEAELYDTSDVNWGMNPATSADGRKGLPMAVNHDAVLAAVSVYIARYQDLSALRAKEGRILSGENRKRIGEAVEAMQAAQKALQELLDATDPGKAARARQQLLLRSRVLAAMINGATR